MFIKDGYEVFVRNLEDLQAGKEIETEIRDCQSYQTKVVRAVFSPSKEKSRAGEKVWVRALVGHLLDEKPWSIKINKVLEER